MKYPELKGLCRTCIGCNLEETPYFTGKTERNNYVKANETGIDLCWKVLKGEQLKI